MNAVNPRGTLYIPDKRWLTAAAVLLSRYRCLILLLAAYTLASSVRCSLLDHGQFKTLLPPQPAAHCRPYLLLLSALPVAGPACCATGPARCRPYLLHCCRPGHCQFYLALILLPALPIAHFAHRQPYLLLALPIAHPLPALPVADLPAGPACWWPCRRPCP